MTSCPQDRFWAKVEKAGPDDCWHWVGNKPNGYGRVKISGRTRPATHVVWWLASGDWPPKGLYVCHRCDVPDCVNPAHLFLGTPADNSADRDRKGRGNRPDPRDLAQVRGSKHGSAKLSEAEVEEILRLSGRVSQYEIARRYGVSQSSISLIVNRKVWTHLPQTSDATERGVGGFGSTG